MNAVGRPSKYTPELLNKAESYLVEWENEDDMIPSVEGLSVFINIARSTLYKWSEEKPEFSDILERINIKQNRELINKGLSGEFNSNITKLVLGKHGYSDKADTTIANPDGSNIEVSTDIEIARKLAFVLDKALKDKASE